MGNDGEKPNSGLGLANYIDVDRDVKRKRRVRGIKRNILKNIAIYGTALVVLSSVTGYMLFSQLEENRMNQPVDATGQSVAFTPSTYKSPDAVFEYVHQAFPEMFVTDFELSYTLLNDGRLIPSQIRFFLPVEALAENLMPAQTLSESVVQAGKRFTMSHTITREDIGKRFTRLTEQLLHENIVRCQTYLLGRQESKFVTPDTQTDWVQVRYDLNIGCGQDQ